MLLFFVVGHAMLCVFVIQCTNSSDRVLEVQHAADDIGGQVVFAANARWWIYFSTLVLSQFILTLLTTIDGTVGADHK